MNPDLMQGASVGAKATMSESGWSNTDVFKDYMENHFLKYVHRTDATQPVLLLFDGHTTHTSPEMILWARERHIHMFVLPAHTSHLLQPLDVSVFGPFKRFYYAECAAYMSANMGKVVTRYQIAELACKAYMKSLTPVNITSGFRKAGIFPLNRTTVATEKLMPCEAFRDELPLQKVQALRGGKEAVLQYLQQKVAPTIPLEEQCCRCRQRKKSKPNHSGREITAEAFLQEVSTHEQEKEQEKENVPPRQEGENSPPRQEKDKENVSPRATTSRQKAMTTTGFHFIDDFSDELFHEEDTEVCCVCDQRSPPNLNSFPHVKLLNWGQCDKCGHWVHLMFCHESRVVRRGAEFLCCHCK